MTPEQTELIQLRARVSELEAAQRQLEIYAEDLRRTFSELRRQLGYMSELHRVSTMIGSVLFARESGKHPAELRNMVTSPGGTTAAALYQMEKGSLRTVISRAVWAAYQRTVELGQDNPAPVPPPA